MGTKRKEIKEQVSNLNWLSRHLTTYASLGLLIGCEVPSSILVDETVVTLAPRSNTQRASANFPDATLPSNAVCDPFGGSQSGGVHNGLLGKLYYLNYNQTRYPSVDDYISYGLPFDADLYFNQLNVPTRMFNRGFVTQDGTTLVTPNGTTLYEYFALHFESVIRLGAADQPGNYQFAILSDDGSIVKIKDYGSDFRTLIDNDGDHPTSLGCAAETIALKRDTALPLQVDYYQGPRFHIALMLIWRHISDDQQGVVEQNCGRLGNNYFFNPNQSPSVPQQPWIDMQARGWKVLSPENYTLPASTSTNPCTGSCFTDRFSSPAWNTFELSHTGIDSHSLHVTLNGAEVQYTYDSETNTVEIPSLGETGTATVNIGFCLESTDPSPSPTPSSSPSPTPSTSPSPTPSASPSPTPSPTVSPSPTPSPTCSGLSCGVLGS